MKVPGFITLKIIFGADPSPPRAQNRAQSSAAHHCPGRTTQQSKRATVAAGQLAKPLWGKVFPLE